MRAIIRFSVDNELNSALRNKLTPILETARFQRGAITATYEQQNISQQNLWQRAQGSRAYRSLLDVDRNALDDLDPAP